jgi:hypothetical protein
MDLTTEEPQDIDSQDTVATQTTQNINSKHVVLTEEPQDIDSEDSLSTEEMDHCGMDSSIEKTQNMNSQVDDSSQEAESMQKLDKFHKDLVDVDEYNETCVFAFDENIDFIHNPQSTRIACDNDILTNVLGANVNSKVISIVGEK